MRNSTLLLAIASAMFMQAAPAAAQNNVPIRKIKAVKPTTELTLLDRVESDTHRKIYQYNEYGYITSVMEYNKEAGQWVLDTDNSYRQEYVFNAAGQCTARTSFNVDKAGNKTTEKNKAKVEVIGDTTWERYYKEYPDSTTHISEAYAYDQWGNRVEEILYGYDSYNRKEFIRRYKKREYSGPVDIYADNANYTSIERGRLLYDLTAKGQDDYHYTMNTNELYVDEFRKIVWQTENDKLYRREYVCRGSMELQVGSIEKKMWKSSESEFALNADGTRPVRETMRSYDQTGEVTGDNIFHSYTWDNLGRLLSDIRYNGSTSEISYKDEYTYADDYAKKLSLREAIEALDGGGQIYPEDEFMQFGHPATSSYYYPDDGDKGESTYEWNANGQLIGGKWTETYKEYDSNNDNPTTVTDYGEIRVGYNADGHLAWKIDHSISENEFIKIEYLYNKEGVWTSESEYSGDSWDGPWTKEGERGNARARKRLATRAATTPKFIDDLTVGSHSIRNSDGVWNTYGNYNVTDGVVTGGGYQQTLVSNASVPANPQYNYTDPLMPLEREDEEAYPVTTEAMWYYYWNTDKGDWELDWGPTEAKRVYNKDGNIVADTYNGNQTIVSTITYRLDDDGRLIEEIYSKGGNITYEYLPGTDYLLESVETAADNSRNVCHYYYSKHNYVDPTGIESIKRNDASTPVWYDLQGRRITTPTSKGIYIVNGKKVMVR
ncbi:hypothetical protein [uncultured Prevotella sp.]|uniref:hypothetical protein n=1 Tax=uncultured Prevotella sp. TaxID=159272 RepID=UPI0026249811|nr:hypothetical protein [uncultured Prevotella sp.]